MPKTMVTTNLEQLAEDIGAYLGMADGITQRDYMDNIITSAHHQTVPDFVKAAALNAKKFNFTHMYEYGVAGLTRGDKRFISPLSPTARLWQDVIVGGGGRKKITFVFRPAKNRVPRHTEEETGVAQEELDKLRINQGKKYVFYNRAEVFEQGIDLNIFPKSAKLLFVPLKGTSFRASPRDEARGFTWSKHVHINPGQSTDSVGQFSAFFFDWWETEGGRFMANRMSAHVTKDIEVVEAEIARNRGPLKPPRSTNITGASARARGKTRKQFTISAEREVGQSEVIL